MKNPTPNRTKKISNNFQNHRGQAVVEFALVASLFLLVFVGICDFGRMIYMQHLLEQTTQQGARAGSIQLQNSDATATATMTVQSLLASININTTNVSVNSSIVTIQGFSAVSVTTTYPFKSMFSGGKYAVIPLITLTAKAVSRKEG